MSDSLKYYDNKGLGSLTYNFCPANFEKKSFYKEHQHVSVITKYNSITANKWIFKTPKSVLYRKILDLAMHYCQK